MEGNMKKAVAFGGVFLALAFVIVLVGEPLPLLDGDCWTEWDGRTNPTVCE